MILNLFHYFTEHYSLPYIFTYISFRSAMASVCGFLIAALSGPWFISKLRILKFGQEIRDDGPQSHLKKSGTPTMGGLLIISAVFAFFNFLARYKFRLQLDIVTGNNRVWPIRSAR